MFTGLILRMSAVRSIVGTGDCRIEIETAYPAAELRLVRRSRVQAYA